MATKTPHASEADRRDAQVNSGWERGQLGDREAVARIELLAALASSATLPVPPAARYPAALLSRINHRSGVLTGKKANRLFQSALAAVQFHCVPCLPGERLLSTRAPVP